MAAKYFSLLLLCSVVHCGNPDKLHIVIGHACVRSVGLAYCALASEALSRGHEVTWILTPGCTFPFVVPGTNRTAGVTLTPEEIAAGFGGAKTSFVHALTTVVPMVLEKHTHMYDESRDILTELKNKGDNVIVVTNPMTTGVTAAAESLNVPVVFDVPAIAIPSHNGLDHGWHFPTAVEITPFHAHNFFTRLGSFVKNVLGAPVMMKFTCRHLNAWRATKGLEPLTSLFGFSRYPTLLRVSPPLAQASYPANVFLIGATPSKAVNREVSTELQRWLDEGPFVFVSFGSVLKPTPVQAQQWVNAFEKLPYRFLWAYHGDRTGVKIPKSVRVEKWVAQTVVLDHPNIQTFVSHGGYSSTIEAIFSGTPLIGVPFGSDQPANTRIVENLGGGVVLDDVTDFEAFKAALTEVIDTKPDYYKQNMEKMAKYLAAPGGVKRGVDVLEMLAKLDDLSVLLNPIYNVPLWEAHAIDLILLLFGVVPVTIIWLFYLCCCKQRSVSQPGKALKRA